MISFNIKVDYNTNMVSNIVGRLRLAAERSVNRVSEEIKNFAVTDYFIQRKTDNPESFIIKSFFVIPAYFVGMSQVWGHVVAGGPGTLPNPNPVAPYAVYVDQGHTYKNGKVFPGYHFMEYATEEGSKIAESIVFDELNKIV
jgi:hypothetical protein